MILTASTIVLKVPVIADSLKKAILKEHKAASEASHSVSAILSSASAACRSRSEGLLSLLDQGSSYNILKFEIGYVLHTLVLNDINFRSSQEIFSSCQC